MERRTGHSLTADESANGVGHAAPLLGEHTHQVLHGLLDMSSHKIQALQRQQVLAWRRQLEEPP